MTLAEFKAKRKELRDQKNLILEAAVKEGRAITSDEQTKFDNIDKEVRSFSETISRLEAVEAEKVDAAKPIATVAGASAEIHVDVEKRDRQAFRKFLMGQEAEYRSLTTTVDASGKVLFPKTFTNELLQKVVGYGGVLSAKVREIVTPTGEQMQWFTADDTSNSAAAHTDLADADDADPTFGSLVLSAFDYATSVTVPAKLERDSAVMLETELLNMLSLRIYRKINALLTNGAGTTEPTGLATATAVPLTGGYTYANVLALKRAVDPIWRTSPSYGIMMNDATLGSFEGILDQSNRPIFSVDQSKLLNMPIYLNSDLADDAVIVGDFSQFYVRRVQGIGLGVDRWNYNQKSIYSAFVSIDSKIAQADALKKVTIAAA